MSTPVTAHISSPGTPLDYNPGASRRSTGLMVVILLHILIVWGLVSGLARKAVEIVKKPVEMKILEDVKLPPPPPPPPPPPKVEKIKETPKVNAPPPPPFVPPPEVQVANPPPAPVIQATQSEAPKAPVEIRPPPPPAPPAPPAPPPPVPVKAEIGVACPGYKQILVNSLAGQYDRYGVTGVVKVIIRIQGKQIVDVTAQSGPREYYRAVLGAVKRMDCTASGAGDVLVPLEVAFTEE